VRICKEIRLADFDTLELSNLNRIRTGIHNLGLPKVVIAAREISEIDPYINVKIYDEGVNQNNIEDFFEGDGKLDSLEVKIMTRLHARQMQIPVVMDTNDRGMLDVERFDIEIDRPIFHGLIKEDELIDIERKDANERLPLLMKIVSFENCSDRLKYSLTQIGKTITSFPQLASAVVLGGAITTDIVRRILLKQHQSSGRFYIDLEKLIF
jgi:ThiF family